MLRLLLSLSLVALFLAGPGPLRAEAAPATPAFAPQLAETPPPLPPGMGEPDQEVPEWYYAVERAISGPVTLGQVKELIAQGVLGARTPVWKEGMADWMYLAEVPALAALLAKDGGLPNTPQAALDEKMRRFLVGTWRYEGYVSEGGDLVGVIIELSYRDDGTYAGMQSLDLPLAGGKPETKARRGKYSVTANDETSFLLSATEHSGESGLVSLKILNQNMIQDMASGQVHFRVP